MLWLVSKETGNVYCEYSSWIDLTKALKGFQTKSFNLQKYVILDEERRAITASNIILD